MVVWEGAYQQAIEKTTSPEGKKELQDQLKHIKGAGQAERLQLTSDYLDSLKNKDPREYQLMINLHEQVGRLEAAVGKEKATSLIEEVNHEIRQVEADINRQLAGANVPIQIPSIASTGIAIERLALRPSNKEIPAHAFGLIFSANIAQNRLADHLAKK